MGLRWAQIVGISVGMMVSCVFSYYEPAAQAAMLQAPPAPVLCDPIISGIASFVFPGWGQHLSGDRGRKLLIHFTVGIALTLAVVYFWGKPEGNFARIGRLAWGVYSGLEAHNTCFARLGSGT